jgi:hypothetical protein
MQKIAHTFTSMKKSLSKARKLVRPERYKGGSTVRYSPVNSQSTVAIILGGFIRQPSTDQISAKKKGTPPSLKGFLMRQCFVSYFHMK